MTPAAPDPSLNRALKRWWSTPILSKKLVGVDDCNKALAEAACQERKSAGSASPPFHAWYSQRDALQEADFDVSALLSQFRSAVSRLQSAAAPEGEQPKEFRVSCASRVAQQGEFTPEQTLPGFVWTGVYTCYSEAGDGSAVLTLQDPRVGAEMVPVRGSNYGKPLGMPLNTSELLLFPAWLRAGMPPQTGAGTHVSLRLGIQFR